MTDGRRSSWNVAVWRRVLGIVLLSFSWIEGTSLNLWIFILSSSTLYHQNNRRWDLLCLKVCSPEGTRISQLCRTKCLIFCAHSPPLTSVHFKNIIFKGFCGDATSSISCNNFSALLGHKFLSTRTVHTFILLPFFFFFFFYNGQLSLSLKTASGMGLTYLPLQTSK